MKNVVIGYGPHTPAAEKLILHTVSAFSAAGCNPILYPMVNWQDFYDAAKHYDAHCHLVRLTNPKNLLDYIKDCPTTLSFLHFGIAECYHSPEYRAALNSLTRVDCVTRIVDMSIHPESCRDAAMRAGILQSDKVVWMYEPPYDDPYPFRVFTKMTARAQLGIQRVRPIVLYYGTFWSAKNPEFLLDAARGLSDYDFYFVGDQSKSNLPEKLYNLNPPPNVRFEDRYITDWEQAVVFSFSDVVALPYSIGYRYDSSAVFNLAMMAHRPAVVPNFDPFTAILKECEVGVSFELNSVESIRKAIVEAMDKRNDFKDADFDRFLSKSEGWAKMGEAIVGEEWKQAANL